MNAHVPGRHCNCCFRWTPEIIDRLRALAGEGKSAAQIGADLRVSRSTIIGKASRCGVALTYKQYSGGPRLSRPINLRPSVARSIALRPTVPKSRVGQHPKRIRAPKMDHYVDRTPVPESGGITIIDLEDGVCHFPYGDPRDIEAFRYCGTSVGETERYCAGHRRVMYAPR